MAMVLPADYFAPSLRQEISSLQHTLLHDSGVSLARMQWLALNHIFEGKGGSKLQSVIINNSKCLTFHTSDHIS